MLELKTQKQRTTRRLYTEWLEVDSVHIPAFTEVVYRSYNNVCVCNFIGFPLSLFDQLGLQFCSIK